MKKITGDMIHLQAEEVANLGAGDKNRDAIGEADNDWPREIFHHRAHARDAKQHEKHSRHHRAHEQAINAVLCDDAGNHHHEGPSRAANLRF